ncbi:MAG: hypothetical protein ABEJ40_08625 [Haloarculaceae archaeon]
MSPRITLSELEAVFGDLAYPASREAVVDELGPTRVALADGETTVGRMLSASDVERFDSADELAAEFRSLLPREAIAAPYPSSHGTGTDDAELPRRS